MFKKGGVLLEKYVCTGMKRISVVVQNRKKQYLIVQNSDESHMEFPGIISEGYKMPEDDTFLLWKRL